MQLNTAGAGLYAFTLDPPLYLYRNNIYIRQGTQIYC